MIPLLIEIDNIISDSYDAYGLIFLEADKRFAAPTKGHETTSYIDEAGEHVDPRTVPDAFDYKIKVLAHKRGVAVSQVISDFNNAIKDIDAESGIETYKTITIYSEYKRVKIVGIPKPIAESQSYFQTGNGNIVDCAEVELTIRVTNPNLCDFNLASLPAITD